MLSLKHQMGVIRMLDQCENYPASYWDWKRKRKMPKYGTEAEIAELDNRFTYHTPHGDQAERYSEINEAAKNLGRTLLENCPPSPEKDDAMRLLSMTRMAGNMSIAINESDPSQQ